MSVANIKPANGYLGDTPGKPTHNVMIIDDRAYKIHNVVVHQFQMSDVDDVEIYAAEPLWQWQQSEMGQWVMKHAIESPMWHRHHDAVTWGHRFAVTAKLKDRDYTFWQLKWGTAH